VLPLVDRDTKQVRNGMPKGAELLSALLDEDPGNDPEGLRKAIEKARAGVMDLVAAKSTFFVFVSPDGAVLRSEADPDLAAGHSLVKEVPDAKQLAEKDGLVELFGYMNGLRGVEKGGDLQWIAGQRVKTKSGKVVGSFVTGWSFRRYVEYLENNVRRHLTETQVDKKRPPPLAYLFLVRGDKAYGGPVTPDEDAEAIAKLGLPGKVGEGLFKSSVELDGRRFAVVAKRLAALDKDVVIALMVSVV
jgi:hypothetical protein